MRIVHTADWHAGHKRFHRDAPGGSNARERDIAATLTGLVDRIIALAPDVVMVAGDIFDSNRPTNAAILHTFSQLARLRAALPETIVLMISGNHDSPKEVGTASILPLFVSLGVHVIPREAQRLRFGELSILAVPDVLGISRPALTPDPTARFNILLLHGEVEGMPKADRGAVDVSAESLSAGRWDYVGLGHFHSYKEIAPNCFYSGSPDYCSSDIFGELAEEQKAGINGGAGGKGFIERDLATGAHTFHPLPASRRLIELPMLDAAGLDPSAINDAIRARVEMSDVDDAIVRLEVRELSRETERELDRKMIRSLKTRALNFQLIPVRPERAARVYFPALVPGARRQTIDEMLRAKLADFAKREGREGADVDTLVSCALGYIDEANAIADAKATPLLTEATV